MPNCLTIVITIFLYGCTNLPDLDRERKAITEMLEMERKAHFEKDVPLFMAEFSDTMVSINRGLVTQFHYDSNRRRIQKYFDQVEFIRWDNTAPPKISFSKDGSLAYAIVQKQVILSIKDSTNVLKPDTTNFAWVSIYRKPVMNGRSNAMFPPISKEVQYPVESKAAPARV